MATFEKRKNTLGQVTAIRVKVRRVGMPHISQTFPVEVGSIRSEKQAEKAAKEWAEEVSKNYGLTHGNLKSNIVQPRPSIKHLWNFLTQQTPEKVTLPFDRKIDVHTGDLLIQQTVDTDTQMLVGLLLECGLNQAEIKQLRWQQFRVNQQKLHILHASGYADREIPLSPLMLEILLKVQKRKYGPMFLESDTNIPQAIPAQMQTLLNHAHGATFDRYIKQEAAHRMVDYGLETSQVLNALGVRSFESLSQWQLQNQLTHSTPRI